MVGPTLCVPFKAARFNNNSFPLLGGSPDTMTKTHHTDKKLGSCLLRAEFHPDYVSCSFNVYWLYTHAHLAQIPLYTHSIQCFNKLSTSVEAIREPLFQIFAFCVHLEQDVSHYGGMKWEFFSFLWIINRIMKAKKNITGSCHWSWHLLSRSKIMLKKSICFVKLSIFLIHLQKIISSYIYISLLNFI